MLCCRFIVIDFCTHIPYAGRDGEFVRPQLSHSGPLAIKRGRHPLMELLPGVSYHPNDTYISPSCPLSIITGPNMSGKSTYLKQVCTKPNI